MEQKKYDQISNIQIGIGQLAEVIEEMYSNKKNINTMKVLPRDL